MKKLKNRFPFLAFDDNNFGYKSAENIEERNEEKSLIIYGAISLFISTPMYPKTDRNFVYAILEQKCSIRPYRHKHFYESSHNKQFWSAKTKQQLIDLIVKEANTDNFKFRIPCL